MTNIHPIDTPLIKINVMRISQCPLGRRDPEHYRQDLDGTCTCTVDTILATWERYTNFKKRSHPQFTMRALGPTIRCEDGRRRRVDVRCYTAPFGGMVAPDDDPTKAKASIAINDHAIVRHITGYLHTIDGLPIGPGVGLLDSDHRRFVFIGDKASKWYSVMEDSIRKQRSDQCLGSLYCEGDYHDLACPINLFRLGGPLDG